MSEQSTSRCRAPNFTREDQDRLFSIVQKYSSIIECKKTDNIKQSQKQAAWAKIQQIYNANTKYVPRSVDNLINCYRNMKSKIKKQHSEAKMNLKDLSEKKKLIDAVEEVGANDLEAVAKTVNQPVQYCEAGLEILKKEIKREEIKHKKKILGTGGGPPPLDDYEDSSLKKLKKIIQPQVDGLYTIYDDDSELMEEFQKTLPSEERLEPIENLDGILENDENIVENLGIVPHVNRQDILKKRKDSALNIPCTTEKDEKPNNSKKTCNDSFQALAHAKLELVHLQKELILMDIKQKKIIYERELEEQKKKSEFEDKVREKKLLLLDLEIKKYI